MSVTDEHAAEIWVCALGTVDYREALEIQESIHELRRSGELPDVLLLLEHPPVYTWGRRSSPGELSLAEERFLTQGIDVVPTKRGGKVTYHGPGQLVGYPIMGVADVLAHVRSMERAIVDALEEEGVRARSRCDEGALYTGVWVGERKIASIGVHVSHGVSTHGFAVNVDNDLAPFSSVIACGLPNVEMTSLERELSGMAGGLAAAPGLPSAEPGLPAARGPSTAIVAGRASGLSRFSERISRCFCAVHCRRRRLVSAERLGVLAGRRASREREVTPA